MANYQLSFSGCLDEGTKKFYTAVVKGLVHAYEMMLPEVFDDEFTVNIITGTMPAIDADNKIREAEGSADAYSVTISIHDEVNNFNRQGMCDRVSHELAHLITIRRTGFKQNGKYLYMTMEGHDLVHLAMNDLEGENRWRLYRTRRKSSIRMMLNVFRFRSPFYYLRILEMKKLIHTKSHWMQLIANREAPTGQHKYTQRGRLG